MKNLWKRGAGIGGARDARCRGPEPCELVQSRVTHRGVGKIPLKLWGQEGMESVTSGIESQKPFE